MQGIFLDFYVAAAESLHWVSDFGLKTQNEKYCGDPTIHTAKLFFSEAPPLG